MVFICRRITIHICGWANCQHDGNSFDKVTIYKSNIDRFNLVTIDSNGFIDVCGESLFSE